MRKQFGLIVPISIFSITILFLTSCNGTNSTPPPSDSSAVVVKDTAAKVVTPRYSLTGDLDNLWMYASSFMNISHKVVFRFYIKNLDTLTLQGWIRDGDQYNDATPDFILNNGSASKVQFGPGNYFGNLQLGFKNGDISIIKKLIKQTNPTYVVFVPVPSSSYAGQINYNIVLTTDDPHSLIDTSKSRVTTPTTVFLNPSPPKNGVQ